MGIAYRISKQHNKNKIEIFTKVIEKNIKFLPIKMIWEINNYLKKQFDLYEYIESLTKDDNNGDIKYKIGMLNIKYLYLNKMNNPIFYENILKNKEYSENLRKLYEENKNHISNFEEFKNIYLFEFQDIQYIAVKNIDNIDKIIKDNIKKSAKKIKNLIIMNSSILIDINDATDMTIYVNKEYLKDIEEILKKYGCEKTT